MKRFEVRYWVLLVGWSLLWAVSLSAAELPPQEGLLAPNEVVEFSSQVPGVIEQLNVERGDEVKKGQILARLKSGVEKAAVNLAKARVEFGQRKANRNAELYKKQLLSVHDKDELETEIQKAQLELAEAEERLKLRTIQSTTDGVVVKRTGAAGAYVYETPFVTVARIDPLNVEVIVPAAYFGMIKKGSSARVLLDKPIEGSYQAKVVIIDQVIDAASGTFGVRLELPNPKLALPAGLKCQVVF
jgi:RND family efflux transporter MFP subunit